MKSLYIVGLLYLFLSAREASAWPASSKIRPWSADRPTIQGIALERETLVVDEGEWKSATPLSFEYQWLRCSESHPVSCRPIEGAQAKAYLVTAKDVGFHLRTLVIAGNDAGRSRGRPRGRPAWAGRLR